MMRAEDLRGPQAARSPQRLAPIVVRRDIEIHRTNPGPYHARVHFSFGDYQDPKHMGVGALVALNHEVHPPAAHLQPRPHVHVQRVTWVVAGELCHRDLQIDSGVQAGGVQRTTPARRSEYLEWNPLPNTELVLIELWLSLSRRPVLHAEQRQYHLDDRRDRWLRIARQHGETGTGVAVDSDARVYVAHLDARRAISHLVAEGRAGYVYLIAGEAAVNMHALRTGDAAVVTDAGHVMVDAGAPSELMLVDTAV